MTGITRFYGWDTPLSKYRFVKFTYNGIPYTSVIKAYEHSKALHFGDKESAETIMKTDKGSMHRKIGKDIKVFIFILQNERWY